MNFKEVWEKVEKVSGWFSEEEAFLLYVITKQQPLEAVIVEMGTAYGRSGSVINLSGRKLITIDKNPEWQGIGAPEIIKGDSFEVSKQFKDESVDMFFLDGDHDYLSVKIDISAWLPKVRIGGAVLFHDFESWHGVTEAVQEISAQGKIWKQFKLGSLLYSIKLHD